MSTKYAQFKRSLKERGVKIADLATKACVSRPHLSLALKGAPGRGGQVRRKVRPLLTPEEIQLLGWAQTDAAAQRPYLGEGLC